MPNIWTVKRPRNDGEYFERMTKTVFTAGLNWRMIENKWPNFRKAFSGFVPTKVAKFSEKNVKSLMKNDRIVKNEKKIRATVYNAEQFLVLKKDYGSFREYLGSFKKDEDRLQENIQDQFRHVGPSTARTFLWSVGHPLTPNAEEKKWMASHHHSDESHSAK